MCKIGLWDYAFTETSGVLQRPQAVVEQCETCGEYRRRTLDELSLKDE